MEARAALVVAFSAGLLALLVVTLDTAYTLKGRLEVRDAQGDWATLAESHPGPRDFYDPGPTGCPSRTLRLVVDNHTPLPRGADIRITYHNRSSGQDVLVLEDRIGLSPFEVRLFEFEVPRAALLGGGTARETSVRADVDRNTLFGTVCEAT